MIVFGELDHRLKIIPVESIELLVQWIDSYQHWLQFEAMLENHIGSAHGQTTPNHVDQPLRQWTRDKLLEVINSNCVEKVTQFKE